MVIPGPSWSLNYNSEFEGEVGIVEEDTPWGSEAKVSIKDEDGKDEVMSFRWGAEDDGVEYIDIWDSASGEILKTFRGHTRDVNAVAFSPCGSKIVSGSDDKTIIVRWRCFVRILGQNASLFVDLTGLGCSVRPNLANS